MITIDGSTGEGGGQILRSSLSLSAITGEPVRIQNIRANRNRPGLMRQHLTAFLAVADICGGHTTGAEVNSGEISLRPGSIKAGTYEFSIGSAGSANLVLQTVLPVLLHADGPSKVTIKGGTHNMASPPFEFLNESFFPALRQMGFGVEAELKSYGFYPAGGGEIEVTVTPASGAREFVLIDRGPELERSLEALVSNLPDKIAHRELETASGLLKIDESMCCLRQTPSAGPGNVVYARLKYDAVTALFAQFGQKSVTSEQVGKRLAKSAKAFAASDAAVTHHLADQLLLPMALAKGGQFSTLRPSLHAETNADIVHRFTGRKLGFEQADQRTICQVS
jgi:RNA 3'-terminal phosphate cyclase (ATP)